MEQWKGVAYLSHPYGGVEEEKINAEKAAKKIMKVHPGLTLLSPLHNFSWAKYHKGKKYWKDLDKCLKVLEKSDYLILSGNWKKSTGCCVELGYALRKGIPVLEFYEWGKLKLAYPGKKENKGKKK